MNMRTGLNWGPRLWHANHMLLYHFEAHLKLSPENLRWKKRLDLSRGKALTWLAAPLMCNKDLGVIIFEVCCRNFP